MRVTLRAINAEPAKRGHHAMLVNGDGYFYFRGGEAVDWLDRTVRMPTLSSLTLDQWLKAFQDLKKKNAEIERVGKLPLVAGAGLSTGRNKRRKS
jgi:hypothetical protein